MFIPDPGSRFFFHFGSRIQGSKKAPDADPQHCYLLPVPGQRSNKKHAPRRLVSFVYWYNQRCGSLSDLDLVESGTFKVRTCISD